MKRVLNNGGQSGATLTPNNLSIFSRTQGKGRIKSLYIDSLKAGLVIYFVIDDIVTSIELYNNSKFTCPLVYTDNIYASTISSSENVIFGYARNGNLSNNKVDEYFIIQDNRSDTAKSNSNIPFSYGSDNTVNPPTDGMKILLPEAITFEKSFILMAGNQSTVDIPVNITIIYDYDDYILRSSS